MVQLDSLPGGFISFLNLHSEIETISFETLNWYTCTNKLFKINKLRLKFNKHQDTIDDVT